MLASTLLATATATAFLKDPTCNPAVHCHARAIECTVCNPSLEKCPLSLAKSQRPGVCSDFARPTIRPDGSRDYTRLIPMNLLERTRRCMQFMDTTLVKDDSQRFKYIASCPEGFFTCYDGSCADKKMTCFRRCDNDRRCRRVKNGRRKARYQMHPLRYLAVRCGQDCRNRREVDAEVCPCTNHTVCSTQVPTKIPGLLPSVTCCNNPLEPTIQVVNMSVYSGSTCCPYLPEGEIIGDESLPSTEPTYNIFPFPVDTYTKPATNFELVNITLHGIEFNKKGDGECCCALHCSCIGDPHCSAFNKEQRSSLEDGLTFNMISESPASNPPDDLDGTFLLNITNGERGVADKLTIKFPNDNDNLYRLASEEAHANCWQRINIKSGKTVYPPQNELPKRLTENFEGTGPQNCPSTLPDDVVFRAKNEIYTNGVNIRYTALKHHNEDYLRFDIFVDRYVQPKKQCCPTPENMISELDQLAAGELDFSGFCYKPYSAESNAAFLPTLMSGRRLELETAYDTPGIDSFCFNQYCKGSTEPSCMADCMMLAYDFGIEALQTELSTDLSTEPSCKDITDPSFKTPLKECQSGVTLEATKKGSNNWQFVRAFPADTHFCGDQLVIPFAKGSELKFTYNGKTQSLSAEEYNVRLLERTDFAKHCNPCESKATIKSFDTTLTLIRSGSIPDITCVNPDQCRACT